MRLMFHIYWSRKAPPAGYFDRIRPYPDESDEEDEHNEEDEDEDIYPYTTADGYVALFHGVGYVRGPEILNKLRNPVSV